MERIRQWRVALAASILASFNRSRSDGLSEFLGRIIRGRVRNEVQSGTLAGLTATKTKFEASAR